ncbi:8-amino-7-oxononanoate synthase [Metabacillus fastidiosus]|uniref:8-amino-7-oxononanoate synthase n=1 Tax=Metabacillus fastidiosus TaxID=1458 RepID=UPI0008241EE6|nr:8-amino-7-oxononanoate synthase [Metabacillus fastidiosus]MED4462694.1 8-amino-7-oxononanoate synthase [Metabacillus fastidiosus]
MGLDQRLTERLDSKKEDGLYRELQLINPSHSDTDLVFSSNDYLGLRADKRLIAAANKALYECGTGSSGSRLTTGNSIWHERLEQRIADFKQTEAALLFSSGYLANVGVLSSIPEKGDILLSDELNHASIIDGCRLSKADTIVYKHADMDDLEEKLRKAKGCGQCFIVTDGVFSMDGTVAPLDKIMKIADHYNAYVIVDDAHATGVLGENGRGTSEYFDVAPDIVIGTLSKAAGTEGGFVCGSKTLIDYLINHARTFIFQTAIPAMSCAASYTALEIIEQSHKDRELLLMNIKKVQEALSQMGYEVKGGSTPIIPVIIGEAEKAVLFAEKLKDNGIYAPAIRPPTVPDGESRIRFTISSAHSSEEINYLLEKVFFIGKELNIIT